MNIPGLEPLSAAERLGVDLAKSEYELIRQLVARRSAAGIKPAELARRMGVDRSTISRFEAGGTNPTMATLNRYAEAIGAMITYDVQPYHVWQSKSQAGNAVLRSLTVVADNKQSGTGTTDLPDDVHVRRGRSARRPSRTYVLRESSVDRSASAQ
ncbi:helix-turn-helix domain-containing protein [Nocardia sp. NBC_01377]|uniref:helix-turn-helix domain-containing protein n=1 Tax=Nocardia sp. NBC_01377 TaxID=2903595 RepID=UPI003247A0EE